VFPKICRKIKLGPTAFFLATFWLLSIPGFSQVSSAMDSLFSLRDKGEYSKAIHLADQLLQQCVAKNQTENWDYGNLLLLKGTLLEFQNRGKESEVILNQSLEICRKICGDSAMETGKVWLELGLVISEQLNFMEANKCFQQAEAIFTKHVKPEDVHFGILYSRLGDAYFNVGDYPASDGFYLKAQPILDKHAATHAIYRANNLMGLGQIQFINTDFKRAAGYFQKSLAICQSIFNEGHRMFGLLYYNLGKAHWSFGDDSSAEAYLMKAKELFIRWDEPNSGNITMVWFLMGSLYLFSERDQQAEHYFKLAMKNKSLTEMEDHISNIGLYHNLGMYYVMKKKNESALANLEVANNLSLRFIEKCFPSFPERQRMAIYKMLTPNLESFDWIALISSKQHPELAGKLFDKQLLTKSLFINSDRKFRQRMASTNDTAIQSRFGHWQQVKQQINELVLSGKKKNRHSLDSLENLANQLEVDLIIQSPNFQKLTDRKVVHWQNVQQSLKPGDAVVEIINITELLDVKLNKGKNFSPPNLGHKYNYHLGYAALILKAGESMPRLIALPNSEKMDSIGFPYYRRCIVKRLEDRNSYNLFWKEIGKALGPEVETVYFSPEGIYNFINLQTLQNPQTGRFLYQERTIRRITSSRDLVQTEKKKMITHSAFVLGFPDFDGRSQQFAAASGIPEPNLNRSVEIRNGGNYSPLPSTLEEANEISGLLRKNRWNVQTLTGKMATEKAVKSTNSPGILHLATHGYFHPSENTPEGMFNSGIILAGANRGPGSEVAAGDEDGILTAYEAMNLNLDETSLVVLSACETGMGETALGQGVFGLQRAFQIAGARNLMMSLWKVSDKVTREFMVGFYAQILRKDSKGKSFTMEKAFSLAVENIRRKYPDPYYWGAFVMVGE